MGINATINPVIERHPDSREFPDPYSLCGTNEREKGVLVSKKFSIRFREISLTEEDKRGKGC